MDGRGCRHRGAVVRQPRCVLTGAGISTASGIPDFRGPEGSGPRTPPPSCSRPTTSGSRDPRSVVARGDAASRPATERPAPNDGHLALVTLERAGRLDTLVTQNVDGLHTDAGSDPARVVEIHGRSRDAVCLRCGDRGRIEGVLDRVAAGDEVPALRRRGPAASGAAGSSSRPRSRSASRSCAADLARAEAAAARSDVLLCVGSTLSVWPIAGMVPLARAEGAAIDRRERWRDEPWTSWPPCGCTARSRPCCPGSSRA